MQIIEQCCGSGDVTTAVIICLAAWQEEDDQRL